MLPLKLRALSDESDESDSDTETPRITKELLEEKALKEYREALVLKQQRRFTDAETLLLRLVNSSLLSETEGQVGYIGGRIQPSLVHLKYGCFINLGSINAEANKLQEALEYYVKAIELDSTDINIWYKIGKIALDIYNLDLAVQAFNNGFECNESHWPTLDNLITALFSIGDYLSCLYMIWRAFQLDADYVKGHVFKQYIYCNHPCFIETFKNVYSECTFRPDQSIPFEFERLILDEAFDLRTKAGAEDQFLVRSWEKSSVRESKARAVRFCALRQNSWTELGSRLTELYEQIDGEQITATYYTPVILVEDSSQHYADVVEMKCEDKNVRISEPSEPGDTNINIKPSLAKRRSMPSTADQVHLDKRRSSRQRGLSKKEDPSLCVALRSVIPEDLLPPHETDMFKESPDPLRWTEDTMDLLAMLDELDDMCADNTGKLSRQFVNNITEGERNTQMSGYFGNPDREAADVRTFLSLHSGSNILNLMISYLRNLCTKWAIVWPRDLKTFYTRIFSTVSGHFSAEKFSVYVDQIEGEHTSARDPLVDLVRTNTMLIILYGELTLNACIERGEFQSEEKEVFPSLLFQDLFEAEALLSLADSEPEIYLRLKHFTYLWSLYSSGTGFTSLIEDLDSLVAALDEINFNEQLVLINSGYYHVISKQVYATLKDVLQVSRDLRDVIQLYGSHLHCDTECNKELFTQLISHLEYSISHEDTLALVKLLKLNTLQGVTTKPPGETQDGEDGESCCIEEEEDIYDVITQYNYLLKLCYELNHNETCFKYSTCYLNKLIMRFKKLNVSINNSAQVNDLWIKQRTSCVNRISDIICRLLYCIEKADCKLFSILPQDQYRQLILNLCQLVCYQIEYTQDSANNASPELNTVPFDTIQHWLVLYYIVKFEENHSELSSSIHSSPDKIQDDSYYRQSSYATRLLFIAHDYLGKRSWCCHENGLLLFKIIEVVTEDYVKYNSRVNHENANFIQFLQHIDQVFYCLYGHPASKQCVRNYIKQKYYLQSHNALGVAFTYERAKQIYFFYKMKKVPEFDSNSKNYSISLDVETLFRNIIREIPEAEKPDKYIDVLTSGIKKSNSIKEIFSQLEPLLCKELRDIYYYIGDYHWKNKVFNKAITYYLLDICVNHSRVDAWVGMTLSQQKLIELTLSSGDTIEEADDITSDCLWTCNSFEITIKLNTTFLPLYIEYGTFAYTIAAFCSRRIKCDSVVGVMSLEQFASMEKLKSDLLSTCEKNFLQANAVLVRHYKHNKIENDEKWLHLYMLGKYYEKTDSSDPKSCLNSYYQSFETLRLQNRALYPNRVNYSEPQSGAVESLELYYRIHATILKFIDRSGDQVLDRELRKYYLEMLRKLSVSKFAFAENDPLEASGANVTIVEDENDVEIMCTVQEVMNNIVKMAQVAEEQDDLYESSSSGSDATSSDSESESSSSGSESSSEKSSDETETSSSEDEKDSVTVLETKKRKLSPNNDEKKCEKTMKKITDNSQTESRKRKSATEPLDESNQKRSKTESNDQINENPLIEKRESDPEDSSNKESVDVITEENVKTEQSETPAMAVQVEPTQSIHNSSETNRIGNITVENLDVKVDTDIKNESDFFKAKEGIDVKIVTVQPEKCSTEEGIIKEEKLEILEVKSIQESESLSQKDKQNEMTQENLIAKNESEKNTYIEQSNSKANTGTTSDHLSLLKNNVQTENIPALKTSSSQVSPKKVKNIIDTINLLDSINNSCDNIFENLNKIASSCDSAVQSNALNNDVNIDNDGNTVELKVEHQTGENSNAAHVNLKSQTTHSSSNMDACKIDKMNSQPDSHGNELTKTAENMSKPVLEKQKDFTMKENITDKNVAILAISDDMEIEIIQDKHARPDVMKVVVLEDSEDSIEEVQVLDPESGDFVTVRQKKIKETSVDIDIFDEKREKNYQDIKDMAKADDDQMEVDENRKILKKDTESAIEVVKTVDSVKNRYKAKATEETDNTDDSSTDNSEEEESDSSSSSESASSSEEEETTVASKKKIPHERKVTARPLKRKTKSSPKNEQTRKKRQEMKRWKKDKKEIVSFCIEALEECHRRFPEHFKSLYRIAHHYFHSNSDKDVTKARTALLGDSGLFRAKRQKDFFKGLWRPPLLDLDRPGSFAYHMSRSVHLVIDVLTETKDAKTLMDIAVALKDEPEAEKKYLRDNEREQICRDALNLCKKILQDNLQAVRRCVITSKSEMKKIFVDARYINVIYTKTWGTKDSVYSRTFHEMTRLFQKTMAMSGDTPEDARMKSDKSVVNKGKTDKPVASEKCKLITADTVKSRSIDEKEKISSEKEDKKEPPARKELPAPTSSIKPQTPLPHSPSAVDSFFGSHFLASTGPSLQSLPRATLAPSSEMSLQQKLAAKQNPTGTTKVLKPLSSAQTHGLSLINRPNLTISSEPPKTISSIGIASSGKLPEPGKLAITKHNAPNITKTVSINPTKYMNKVKNEALKTVQRPTSQIKPLVNIKPLQKPAHLIENKSAAVKTGSELGFKLPKSVSLTKVHGNTARSQSPNPKAASITKVQADPPKPASPKVVDVTTPTIPKAISVSKVQGTGQDQTKPAKIKKPEPDTSVASSAGNKGTPSNKNKKQLGPKSKTKETLATGTSALKNFRMSKDGKDKEEIIMIEID